LPWVSEKTAALIIFAPPVNFLCLPEYNKACRGEMQCKVLRI